MFFESENFQNQKKMIESNKITESHLLSFVFMFYS